MMACQPGHLEEESHSECSSDPLVVAQLATTNPGKGLQPETSDDGRERAVGAHSSNLVAQGSNNPSRGAALHGLKAMVAWVRIPPPALPF